MRSIESILAARRKRKMRMRAAVAVGMTAVVSFAVLLSAYGESSSTPEKGVHFYFLLDRSGSMSSIRNDVIGGFNAYVKDQNTDDDSNVSSRLTLVQFDSQDKHEVHIDGVPMHEVRTLTQSDFQPRGSTPLNDAIALVIARAERQEKPDEEDTIVVIFTDGEENDSTEHTRDSIAKLIEEKEKVGWTFVYMGANVDAFEESSGIAIQSQNTQNYVPDARGVRNAFASISKASKARKSSILLGDAPESFFDATNSDAQKDFEQRSAARNHHHHQGNRGRQQHIPSVSASVSASGSRWARRKFTQKRWGL